LADTKAAQEAKKQKEAAKIAEIESKKKNAKNAEEMMEDIVSFFVNNKTNGKVIKPILDKCRELGYNNPKEISSIEDVMIIHEMIS